MGWSSIMMCQHDNYDERKWFQIGLTTADGISVVNGVSEYTLRSQNMKKKKLLRRCEILINWEVWSLNLTFARARWLGWWRWLQTLVKQAREGSLLQVYTDKKKIVPFKQSFNGDIFLEQEYDSSVKLFRSRVARRFQTGSETLVRHNLQNPS